MIDHAATVRTRIALFLAGVSLPGVIGGSLGLSPPSGGDNGWCSLSRVESADRHYRIGQPEGWRVETLGGATAVRRDARTVAFVYRAGPGEGPAQLVRERGRVIAKAAGVDVQIRGNHLQGSVEGVGIDGDVFVEVHGSDLVLAGGWAPTPEWPAIRPVVAEVGRCYARSNDTSGGAVTTAWAGG